MKVFTDAASRVIKRRHPAPPRKLVKEISSSKAHSGVDGYTGVPGQPTTHAAAPLTVLHP